MSDPWRITLFGGLRAQHGEQVITRFKTQKVASLFAYLAFHLRQAHASHPLSMKHPGELARMRLPGVKPKASVGVLLEVQHVSRLDGESVSNLLGDGHLVLGTHPGSPLFAPYYGGHK